MLKSTETVCMAQQYLAFARQIQIAAQSYSYHTIQFASEYGLKIKPLQNARYNITFPISKTTHGMNFANTCTAYIPVTLTGNRLSWASDLYALELLGVQEMISSVPGLSPSLHGDSLG